MEGNSLGPMLQSEWNETKQNKHEGLKQIQTTRQTSGRREGL